MKVGIQLFSVKTLMAEDPLATIRRVSDIGYRYLEGANHTAGQDNGIGFGVKADDLKRVLEDTGSSVVSCHLMPITLENIDGIIEYQKAIGSKYIVDPADFFPEADAVLRKAETCNRIGEKCKAAGMGFLYHNHFHEFHKLGGDTVMDLLLRNTDPALVGLELDTYWVMRAGVDPVAFIREHGDRIKLVHQKDYPKGQEEHVNFLAKVEAAGDELNMDAFMKHMDTRFVEIGTGVMPIQQIIDAVGQCTDCEYVILEQDMTQMGELESIELSMAQFKQYGGMEW